MKEKIIKVYTENRSLIKTKEHFNLSMPKLLKILDGFRVKKKDFAFDLKTKELLKKRDERFKWYKINYNLNELLKKTIIGAY